jgi:DNA topoisomerase IA
VLAICSTREDAVALQEATGIRAVRITLRAFPAEMQLRCALRRVIIATRQDKSGEAIARRIVETCTLSTLKRIPWPQEELDEETLLDTLRNLFAP